MQTFVPGVLKKFDNLKKNLEHEKKIVADMRSIKVAMQSATAHHTFYLSSLKALRGQLRVLNKVVPEFLKEGSPLKKFEKVEKKATVKRKVVKKSEVIKVKHTTPSGKEKKYITVDKGNKKEFLKKLKLSEDSLKGLKKAKKKAGVSKERKPNEYMKFSNKYFLNQSEKVSPSFKDLAGDLKKSNMPFMLSSYLSMAIMSMVIAFIFGFLLFGVMMIVDISNWIYILAPFGFAFFDCCWSLYVSCERG